MTEKTTHLPSGFATGVPTRFIIQSFSCVIGVLGVGDSAFVARGTIRQAAKAAALSLIWIVISSYFSSPGDESLGSRPGRPVLSRIRDGGDFSNPLSGLTSF